MLDTLLKHLPMVRLSAGMVVMLTIAGCTGLITGGTGGGSGLTPEQQVAQQKWLNEALPVLKANCTACHAVQDPTFLAGKSDLDIRDTLLKFDPQVVNLNAPQSSRLLTKGAHNGPALLADQASALLEWIQAEQTAAGATTADPTLATAKFVAQPCTSGSPGYPPDPANPTCPVNHVDLTPLGLPGATIDFVAQALDSQDTYVTDLVVTPSTDGVYMEHPLFVSWPNPTADNANPDPIPDTIDRYFDVALDLAPCTTAPATPCASTSLDGGTAAFVGFNPTAPMQIQFKAVDKYKDMSGSGAGSGSGTATGGCKALDSFKTNVIPLMTAAGSCSSCHMTGENQNAINAMDITGITTTDDTMLATACAQVRTRVNFQAPTQSGVLLAPDPNGDGAHPFKLGGGTTPTLANFQTGVTTWINAEAIAP